MSAVTRQGRIGGLSRQALHVGCGGTNRTRTLVRAVAIPSTDLPQTVRSPSGAIRCTRVL